jgi:hypothetical protein
MRSADSCNGCRRTLAAEAQLAIRDEALDTDLDVAQLIRRQ